MGDHKEFEDFSIHFLNADRKYSSGEPVEGYVRLVVSPLHSNRVRDVCINCLGYSRFSVSHNFANTQHGELKRFFNETQRSACQFDHGGIPEGTYEFPFSFDIPRSASSSIKFERHQFGLIVFRGTIAYQITALLLNEGDSIQEPTLRATATFNRYVTVDPEMPLAPLRATEFEEFEGCEAEVSAEVEKPVYEVGDVCKVSIRVKYLNPKYWVKRVAVKLIQTSELEMETEGTSLCEIENVHKTSEVTVYPVYDDVRLVSRSRNDNVTHLYDLEAEVPLSTLSSSKDELVVNSLSKNIVPTLTEDSVMKDSEGKTFHINVSYFLLVDVHIAKSSFLKSRKVTLRVPVDLFLSKEDPSQEDVGTPRYYSEITLAKYTRNEDDLRNFNESKVTDLQRLRERTFFFMSSSTDGSTNEQFFENLNGESISRRETSGNNAEEDGQSSSNDSSFTNETIVRIPKAGTSGSSIGDQVNDQTISRSLPPNFPSGAHNTGTALVSSGRVAHEDGPPPSYNEVVNGAHVYNKIQMTVDIFNKPNDNNASPQQRRHSFQ
eukprot:Nk52_evm83s1737 gene=Nk52_evmTU83s1737